MFRKGNPLIAIAGGILLVIIIILLASCAPAPIEDVEGIIYLGADDLSANGSYRAMYVLNAPQAGVYNCAIYLRILHPSVTADSYMTFDRITVEVAP